MGTQTRVAAPATLGPLEGRVREHCERQGLLPAGRLVLVLLSGGPDSTCALDALVRLHDGPVHALVIDHGLREESAEEARRAAETAVALGVPASIERVRVPAGASVQDQARSARWKAALASAERLGAAVIATGHTADDQAETVLFRIARGTGRSGLLGMAPKDGDVVRPVMCLRASETRQWCDERGLPSVADPSNDDPRFARARVRNDALPALERVHPGAVDHLAELSDLLRDEAELLEPIVAAAWVRCERDGGLVTEQLAVEHPAVQRLLVRRMLEESGAPGEARGRRSVERVLDAAGAMSAATLPGDVDVRTIRGVVSAAPPRATARAHQDGADR